MNHILYTITFTPNIKTGEPILVEKHEIYDEYIKGYMEDFDNEEEAAREFLYETYCMEYHQGFINCITLTEEEYKAIKLSEV